MDFLMLLVVTLAIAIGVSALVVRWFRGPMDKIFLRIIGEEVAEAWRRFLTFALFVVGISSGVQIWNLELFVMPVAKDHVLTQLTPEYWCWRSIARSWVRSVGWLGPFWSSSSWR